jgi:hypothetical protein
VNNHRLGSVDLANLMPSSTKQPPAQSHHDQKHNHRRPNRVPDPPAPVVMPAEKNIQRENVSANDTVAPSVELELVEPTPLPEVGVGTAPPLAVPASTSAPVAKPKRRRKPRASPPVATAAVLVATPAPEFSRQLNWRDRCHRFPY